MVAELHAGIHDSFGAGRVSGNLVADLEERRLGIVGGQNAQQPIGIRGGAVVERQRHAFDLCAVDDIVGAGEPDMPGERADRDDGGGCHHTGDGAPVPPRKGVWSSRHGGKLTRGDCKRGEAAGHRATIEP